MYQPLTAASLKLPPSSLDSSGSALMLSGAMSLSGLKRRGSPGKRLRTALRAERPLQVVGVINAYAAILAEKTGFKALYLSGGGVANASRVIPDIGLTTLAHV